ncbi:hypothetical protein N7532_011071 [Penicillium argentinense]|uniref:C2H2-type domain-containing protein n=1 Tax=Penicillium argentinense TaxID=1131581 RepID=A0A9W9EHQ3_9EURO|nr:uncharacterized protein N7532_011071 [Penicillium argentinense]KAJ5082028.1 hypothetical protein N7532_011071 [Penicillium argentinense]
MTGYLYTSPERRSGLQPNGFPVPGPGPLSPPSEGASPQLPAVASAWAKLNARDTHAFASTMSSPHSLSPAGHPLELTTADPYLAAAPSDPEETEFQANAIRLTPVNGSPGQSVSSLHDGSASVTGHSHGPEYLSPQGNQYIDPAACTSPMNNAGFVMPQDMDLANGVGSWSNEAPTVSTQQAWPTTMAMDTSQYLNPEPTIPSPASPAQNNHLPMMPGSFVRPPQPGLGLGISNQTHPPPRLSVSAEHVKHDTTSPITRGRSPTVTVEYFGRGDSPKGEGLVYERRASYSSNHLSVNDGQDEEYEDDHRSVVSSQSVGRKFDSNWTGQGGLDPLSRGSEFVPSPNDLKCEREREQKIDDINRWSEHVSEAGSDVGDDPDRLSRRQQPNGRVRARSTGDRPLQQEDYFSLGLGAADHAVPGPRLMVHETSDDEYSETSESTADVNDPDRYNQTIPEMPYTSSPDEDGVHIHPWQDAPRDPIRTEQMQPGTSSAAMTIFERRAKDLETASLAATIGDSIFGFERMSLYDEPRKTEKRPRSNSIFKRAHQQASNMLKRQASDLSLATTNSHNGPQEGTQRKDSGGSGRHRLSLTANRHFRSPSLSNALLSMSGQLAAVGGSHSVQAVSPTPEPSPGRNSLNQGRNSLNGGRNSLQIQAKRGRSRSEVPRPHTPGLMDLMTTHGGPPVASITRYQNQEPSTGRSPASAVPEPDSVGADDGEDVDVDDKGIVMQFPPVTSLPVPTYEGFKTQIMQLNPRLEPALLHRFALSQVQRFKTLVELQQKHATAVANRTCKSGQFCTALGGKPALLYQQKTPANSEAGQTQFRVTDYSQGGDQTYVVGDGAIAAAQFPPGVPLPPVSGLPAQFECPICFQVKKFQKPSDWTKHVHEDIQPFTCSFPECTDPKSFKRKADWVRHESERHRQLEWWTCSFPDCPHTCFRRHNFVQHLVREHKMIEPKGKKPKGSAESAQDQEFWRLVEHCYGCKPDETPSKEPCRFCGNVCNSWKRLTVHLGKHMEQLAMPVLELAKQHTAGIPVGPVASNPSQTQTQTPGSQSRHSALLDAAPAPAHDPSAHLRQQQQQQQYATSDAIPAASHSHAFLHPEMSMLGYQSILGTQPSMEPDEIDHDLDLDLGLRGDQIFPNYDLASASASYQGAPPQQTTLSQSQSQPLHQNPSTYPGSCNAVPRSRTPEQNPALLQNSYSLSPQYPPHAQAQPQQQHPHHPSLYLEQGYTYQPVAQSQNGSYTSAYTSSYSSRM